TTRPRTSRGSRSTRSPRAWPTRTSAAWSRPPATCSSGEPEVTRSAGADVGSLGRRTPPWRRLLAMLALVLGVGLSMASAPPATADDGDLEIELTAVSPAVVTTGDELVITGRVHNRTD